jgi:hypothetical protein
METRRTIQDRIEQYRSLIRGTLDRSSHEVLKKKIEVEVDKLNRLNHVEADRDRYRMLS